MADVHISHATEDAARADELREALVGLGFEAPADGDPDTAKAVIALWSEDSVRSERVRADARAAAAREALVSVQIEECRLPLEIRPIHTELLPENEPRENGPVWTALLARIAELAGCDLP